MRVVGCARKLGKETSCSEPFIFFSLTATAKFFDIVRKNVLSRISIVKQERDFDGWVWFTLAVLRLDCMHPANNWILVVMESSSAKDLGVL